MTKQIRICITLFAKRIIPMEKLFFLLPTLTAKLKVLEQRCYLHLKKMKKGSLFIYIQIMLVLINSMSIEALTVQRNDKL